MKTVEDVADANVVLIQPGGETKFWQSDEPLSLEQSYEVAGIDRGYIQLLPLHLLGADVQLLVHEEGKLRDLPYNEGATKVFWAERFLQGVNPDPDFIVGPALILSGKARWT